MSTERKQILDMLAAGKISAEDADRLLDKVTRGGDAPVDSGVNLAPRFMCVRVDTSEGDLVNVRVPLGLVKSGLKLSSMMPKSAAEAIAKNGIDLSQLSGLSNEQLVEFLRLMQVDVESAEGDQVRIYCE